MINFSDEYELCIGLVGLSKEEYFNLTPAETHTKVKAYVKNRDLMSANFRALFHLQFNQWAKNPKSRHELWPLSIDEIPDSNLTMNEIYERNREIIARYRAQGEA